MAAQGSEKIFEELGLTRSQIRVYLALIRLSVPSTAKAVSAYLNIARQDIYRTLTELQEMGLTEVTICSPALYKAIPAKQAIAILLKRRNEKTDSLLQEAQALFEAYDYKDAAKIEAPKERFIIVPRKEACIAKIDEAIQKSQKCIQIITPWREATQWLFILNDSWRKALDRGVEVCWLTPNKINVKSIPKNTWALIEKPYLKVKTQQRLPLPVRFMVFDCKEAFIAVDKAPNAGESPALWSNNSLVLSVLCDYFETKWDLSSEWLKDSC